MKRVKKLINWAVKRTAAGQDKDKEIGGLTNKKTAAKHEGKRR
jgi:hypothetical protein